MITGFFSSRGRPYISGIVTLPRFGVFADVSFLLDTVLRRFELEQQHLEDTAASWLSQNRISLATMSYVGGKVGRTAKYEVCSRDQQRSHYGSLRSRAQSPQVNYRHSTSNLSYADETFKGRTWLLPGATWLDEWQRGGTAVLSGI